jgi:hypothetical protein
MKRLFAALALAAVAGATGCGDDSGDASAASEPPERGTILKLSDTSTPGKWSFERSG